MFQAVRRLLVAFNCFRRFINALWLLRGILVSFRSGSLGEAFGGANLGQMLIRTLLEVSVLLPVRHGFG